MDNRIQRAAENFIMNLAGANATEIQEYIAEIRLNREFNDSIEEIRRVSGRRRYASWYFGIGTALGMTLYAICRR